MKFLIVTPSLNQIKWLMLCVASVADQVADCSSSSKNFQQPENKDQLLVHHHVQDAISSDGTINFLSKYNSNLQKPHNKSGKYTFSYCCHEDKGMYDAINRGWALADDSVDILAYLNCDEQYLPNALYRINDYFSHNNKKEVVFANAIIVDSLGEFICFRKTISPTKYHSLVSSNLSFFTCSTFIRRDTLIQKKLFFDHKWKDVGDAAWGIQLIKQNIHMGNLNFFSSAFSDTGNNMNTHGNALREKLDLFHSAPKSIQMFKKLIILKYRINKLFQGCYFNRPLSYQIYTSPNNLVRKTFHVKNPTFIWKTRR